METWNPKLGTMPRLSAQLSALLRCPITGSAFEQVGDTLVSLGTDESGHRIRYPVIDGIPVLLAEAAIQVPRQ